MKSPYFSIIIPAYNVSEYIKECLESLETQTYKDFEVIIVDDGSTDDTLAVCKSLLSKFPNTCIQVVHQSNQRQIAARMNGIDHANGEYCLFVDADDKLVADALEVIKGAIDKYSADIVIYNGVRFWDGGSVPFWQHYKNEDFFMEGEYYLKFQQDAVSTSRFNNVWNKAFKREILLKSRRFENVSFINIEEDYLMQLPWYDTAKSAVYIPQDLYLYRFNPASVTQLKFNADKYRIAALLFKETMPYYKKWNVSDAKNKCIRKFMAQTSSAIKQFYSKESNLSKVQKKDYLLKIANDELFRTSYKQFDGILNSKVGRVALWLLYHKLWRLTLWVVEHDPKVHGKSVGYVGK